MSRIASWLYASVGVALLASAATGTRADADLWGHLRFGLDFLRDWRLPGADPYSFTQDTSWINHEWLSEAQMALAWTIGGASGLAVLKGALAACAFVLVWSSLAGTKLVARILIALMFVLGTIHMWATLRPQLWTFIAFALLCRILRSDRVGALVWLPLIFAIWVNCHGGWIVGLGVLGAWAAGRVIWRPAGLARWAALVLACVVATLANPYGWNLWLFMLRTVHMRRAITEWGSLWGTPWLNWLPWFAGVGLTLWVCRPPIDVAGLRERASPVLVLVVLAYSAARVMRIESLFVVAAAILTAGDVARRWPSKALKPSDLKILERAAPFVAGLCLVSAVAIAWRTTRCLPTIGDWAPDVQTAHALDAARPGRLVTYFDWGEYAIWHFGSRLKVSMDGRRETVYTDARLAEHDAIVAGHPAGLTALAQWDAEYVWLPATSTATRAWLASNGYRIDVSSPRSFIAVRADLPVLRAQAFAGPADCFPE